MKILVFNPSFIGDSILTVPLINAISAIYPASRIYFCVRPESAELFRCLKNITEVITFDKRGRYSGVSGFLNFSKKLKKYDFDMIFTPHKSIRSILLLKFTGCSSITGFRQSVLNFLLDKQIDRDMNLHEVERNLMLLSNLNRNIHLLKASAGFPAVCMDTDFEHKISSLVYSLKRENKCVVGIAPASAWNTKMWPVDYYSELIDTLYKKGIYSFVISGPDEYPTVRHLKSQCRTPFLDFAGKTSLIQLSGLLRNIDLLICNDSAPMHIAAALKTPVLALFGPTTKSLGFFPYGAGKSRVIENHELKCRPCSLHGGKNCPEGHFRCMKDIMPEKVIEIALDMLS